MNFIDAVKALKEGKCKGVKRIFDINSLFVITDSSLHANPDVNISDILAEDWELVEPIKQYEEVEVVKWYSPLTNRYHDKAHDSAIPSDCIKLTGTIKKEIKPKVKNRKEIKDVIEVISKNHKTRIAPISKIFLEWEE